MPASETTVTAKVDDKGEKLPSGRVAQEPTTPGPTQKRPLQKKSLVDTLKETGNDVSNEECSDSRRENVFAVDLLVDHWNENKERNYKMRRGGLIDMDDTWQSEQK